MLEAANQTENSHGTISQIPYPRYLESLLKFSQNPYILYFCLKAPSSLKKQDFSWLVVRKGQIVAKNKFPLALTTEFTLYSLLSSSSPHISSVPPSLYTTAFLDPLFYASANAFTSLGLLFFHVGIKYKGCDPSLSR